MESVMVSNYWQQNLEFDLRDTFLGMCVKDNLIGLIKLRRPALNVGSTISYIRAIDYKSKRKLDEN